MMPSTTVSGSLSFIHIPKNAGSSIKRAIEDNQIPMLVSNHAYPRKLGDEEVVVLRCPIDRFVSAFHYGHVYWPNPVNAQFADPSELAVSAADPEHPKHALAWAELGNRPEHFLLRDGQPTPPQTVGSKVTDFCWVYEPQSTWLVNAPRHILRYRHLPEDFEALIAAMRFPGRVVLPWTNKSRRGPESLSADAMAFIEKTYAADFDFIRAHGLDV